MAYEDFKDLTKRTASDKYCVIKHLVLLKTQNMMDIKGALLQWFQYFNKKTAGGAVKKVIQNDELAEELHKPITRKFTKRKVYSPFIDNICSVDLANMQLISKFNKRFQFLLCVNNIFIDMHGLFLWKTKKVLQLLTLFKKSYTNLIEKKQNMGR